MFHTVCDVCDYKVNETTEQPFVTNHLCDACIKIEDTVGLNRCDCGELATEMNMYCFDCFEALD